MLLLALDDEEEEEEKENFEVETLDEREEMANANGKREKEAKQFPNPRWGSIVKKAGARNESLQSSKFTRAEKKGSEIGAINLTIKFPRETKLYPRQTYTVQRVVPSLNENEK